MASERIINEYDSTRIANAVDTLATNLADYSGTTVTPTDAMKAKLPSQTTADRIADALEDIAEIAVNGAAYGSSNSAKSTVAKSVTTINGNFNLAVGAKVIVKFAHGSDSSNLTLNVDSTGAKPVYMNGAALEEELEENGTYQFVYNGTQFDLVGGAGGGGGPQTAIIALSATTASVDNATSTATITMTTNSDGVPSVSSSDSSIATASISNNTITITGVGSGNATVTVSIPATSSYTAATATIDVTSNVWSITIGDTYFFGGFYWTAAEDLGNNSVCLQSQGMTSGAWPGYKLTTDYSGTKNYGNANTAYGSNIDGDNIANYDEVTQAWYSKYSAVEKTGQAYGSGLFLVSNTKCGSTTSGDVGSGNYDLGLKIAAGEHTSNRVWIGTGDGNGYAWQVNMAGKVLNQNTQYATTEIAPAFNLDLTKVKLDGSTIMLLSESKPKIVSWSNGTKAEIKAMLDADKAGIIDIAEYWSDGDVRTVTLPAMAATGVGESHAQQSAQYALSFDSCLTLTNTVACGRKRSKLISHKVNSLEEAGYIHSTATNTGSWGQSARRTWCNNVYKAAMIEAFDNIFEEFESVTAETYNGTTLQTVDDYFALPAAAQVYKGDSTYGTGGSSGGLNTTAYSNLTEFNALSRFKYYEIAANRIKKKGDDGIAFYTWERSPHFNNAGGYCLINAEGTPSGGQSNNNYGISPFSVIA